MHITINGTPITKKNSQRICINGKTGRPFIAPSSQYKKYEKTAGYYIPGRLRVGIDYPVNVQCLYYMPTRRAVDLNNLLEASCDILVEYGVLKDDNCKIVAGHDGSRVLYDKNNPRVEIYIREMMEG